MNALSGTRAPFDELRVTTLFEIMEFKDQTYEFLETS